MRGREERRRERCPTRDEGMPRSKDFDSSNSGHPGSFKKKKKNARDFPGGAVVKNLPAKAGDTGSSPGLGRSHMPRSN